MQYYATVNTAHPATGLITTGEMLTEKQVSALGAEMIANLLERGVLAACGDKPKAAAPSPAPKADDELEAAPLDEEPEDDEELPELEMTDEIVGGKADEPAPKKQDKKSGGNKK